MRRPTHDLTGAGWAMVAAVSVLLAIGLSSIYVSDTHYAVGDDGPLNAAKQAARIAAGAALASIVLRVGYPAIGRHSYAIFVGSVVLLAPLFAARLFHTDLGGLTTPRNGAYRWIHLPGIPLQPSEFVKVSLVISLAWYLRYRRNYRRFSGLAVPFLVTAGPMALILFEPDLGTAMLLVPVLFTMLFVAGARIGHLALIAVLGAAAIPPAWGLLAPYQRSRVSAVLLQSPALRKAVIEHPEKWEFLATRRQAIEWAASSGYQLVQSKNAIGSGGLTGQGWGRGVYVQSGLLPDRHNDFVFAIVCHQWGFAGALAVILCYGVIVGAGVRIASATSEPFARLLAAGVVALIASQAVISMAMTMGLLPITGMTLPFVSYGGSSLMFHFGAMALLISVSQHRPYLLTTDPRVLRREQHERLGKEVQDVAQGGSGGKGGTIPHGSATRATGSMGMRSPW